jgi:hypothetical protein
LLLLAPSLGHSSAATAQSVTPLRVEDVLSMVYLKEDSVIQLALKLTF